MAGPMSTVPPPDTETRATRWKAWLAPLADAFVAVARLRGTTAHGGLPATMLVAGPERRVRWVVDRFFASSPERESLGHVPAWRLARTLRRLRASADLTVARVSRVTAAHLGFGDDYLPVPDWIGMRLDAPFDADALARRSHSAWDDMRRTRIHGWHGAVSHRASDFAAFYRDMYVPFARNRHHAETHLHPRRRLRKAFRRGGLLQVGRGDAWIGGLLFECRHDVLDAVALGVAGGDPGRLKEGALAATYVQMFDHARRSGCVAIDLRGSRPSPDDGLTRYKRKWGASVYDRPDVLTTTLVHWSRMSPAVAEFLTHTPLIFHDGGGLSSLGIATATELSSTSPAQACRRLRVAGSKRTIVLVGPGTPVRPVAAGCTLVPASAADAGPRALLAMAAGPPAPA